MYADGFLPREVDFMVVDNHPTLLNVTLYPSKVGDPIHIERHLWQPPWLDRLKYNEGVNQFSESEQRGDSIPRILFKLISQGNAFNSVNPYTLIIIVAAKFV